MLAFPAPAQAHAFLLFTTPTANSAVVESPASVDLVFNERVTAGADAVVLVDSGGRATSTGPVKTARDGGVVTAQVPKALPPGEVTVRWRVTGEDGDLVEGEFRFAIGAAPPASSANEGGPGVSWVPAGLRWMLFTGLALALGGLVARRGTAVPLAKNPELRAVRSLLVFGALAGLAATVGLAAPLIAEVGTDLWQAQPGQLLLTEAAGFSAAALLLWRRRHAWAAAALTAVVIAEGLRSHADVAEPVWGALLTSVHLAAAAVWVGALVHTVRTAVAWRGHRAAVRWVITEYAGTALWLFLVVAATGTAAALLLVPVDTLFTTDYGRILMIKVVLVLIAVLLAGTARLYLKGDDARLGRVRMLARTEAAVLAAALAAAAVLVSAPLPSADALAAPPPAADGPELPLGTLAGQIGVNLTASQGQLVIRLATPRWGNYYAPEPGQQQDFELSGALSPVGGAADDLTFRPCGRGCFVAGAALRDGENLVTLRAEAPGWRGGDVALIVPWPVTSAADALADTAARMEQVDNLTVYETVTSDGTAELPPPTALPLSGPTFLGTEPYGAGVAPIVVRSDGEGAVRLYLAFPAEARTAELLLDVEGRIVEETLTDPKHVILRRFTYPEVTE
ncbi:copper resistance protein CopC [Blastococcus sp. CT_GayMR19]|nr:copper resistance protein CopC [Blastococcus sp. CT_GayMR19]